MFIIKKLKQELKLEALVKLQYYRLGYISKKRIVKLAEITEGITIKSNLGKEVQVYEAYQLVDAPKQISRRKIGQAYSILGRVYFDLV